MSGYLKKINMTIPFSTREVNIDLNGRTLILTGSNGCGKTQVLNYLFERISDSVVNKNNPSLNNLEQTLSSYMQQAASKGPTDQNYDHIIKRIEQTKASIKEKINPSITIENLEDFIVNYDKHTAILSKFEAMRKSDIIRPDNVTSLDSLREQDLRSVKQKTNKNGASIFEKFLVTNIANQAFSESTKINNNPSEAQKIDNWFKKLEADLKNLFEDENLELLFKPESLSFEIKQPDKNPYTFQTLSSGFSSIMSVYADLITKVSLRSIEPHELTGIVLIDEIDAHLHVSLQKKILAFFKEAFPNIQFIVTTHSPFVVSSIKDAVIFDLSRLEQVEDMSMYSYEAVLEGLFGVLPISKTLQGHVENLAELLREKNIDTQAIEEVLKNFPDDYDSLDSESQYFVQSAQIALNMAKRGRENV